MKRLTLPIKICGHSRCCNCGEPMDTANYGSGFQVKCNCGSTEFIWEGATINDLENYAEKKEEPTMKVEYNGFTGKLVTLEAAYLSEHPNNSIYDLTIFERDKKAEHSFKGVKLSDIKFLGGSVSFGE